MESLRVLVRVNMRMPIGLGTVVMLSSGASTAYIHTFNSYIENCTDTQTWCCCMPDLVEFSHIASCRSSAAIESKPRKPAEYRSIQCSNISSEVRRLAGQTVYLFAIYLSIYLCTRLCTMCLLSRHPSIHTYIHRLDLRSVPS